MKWIACLGALLLVLTGAFPVWADSWDESRLGSLTVNTSYVTGSGDSQVRNPVKNVEISLYQVAKTGMDDQFVTYIPRQGLESYEAFFNSGFSGEDNFAAAAELSKWENLETYQVQEAVKTNDSGKAFFANLEPGMYLVLQTAKRTGFYNMEAFLAAVPSMKVDGSGWEYQVEARPKIEKEPDSHKPGGGGGNSGGGGGDSTPPKEPTASVVPEIPEESFTDNTPEDFPDGKLPQTGMHRSWMLAFLCVGAACIGVGWRQGRRGVSRINRRNLFLGLGILGILGSGMMEGKNLLEDRMAGAASAEAMKEIEGWIEKAGSNNVSMDRNGVSRAMGQTGNDSNLTEENLDAAWSETQSGYTGILSIPSLDLELPVQDHWSYPALRKTPCRYYGAAQSDDLVIFAHNYDRHFGNIKDMQENDEVFFTDMDGQIHIYAVDEVIVISPYETETMTAGEWDLILFTCTYGGENRVAVRCQETMEKAAGQKLALEF